eukprot:1180519-Prorocentrum_minimum.AAC.1
MGRRSEGGSEGGQRGGRGQSQHHRVLQRVHHLRGGREGVRGGIRGGAEGGQRAISASPCPPAHTERNGLPGGGVQPDSGRHGGIGVLRGADTCEWGGGTQTCIARIQIRAN